MRPLPLQFKSHTITDKGKCRGVFVPPMEQLTAQGYDSQFGTNVLSKSSLHGKARIVNTISSAHTFTGPIDFSTLKEGPERTKKGPQPLYAQSKLASFLSLQPYADGYVVRREMSKYQTNLPNDMKKKASYLPLLIPEILDPTSNVISPLFQYFVLVSTYDIFRTPIPSLITRIHFRIPYYIFIWRFDAIMGWHTPRSGAEWQGKSN